MSMDEDNGIGSALGGIAGSMIMYAVGMAGFKHIGGVVGQALMKGAIQVARKTQPIVANRNYQRLFNRAVVGLSKMPTQQMEVRSKDFFSAMGVNTKLAETQNMRVLGGFIEDQVYSLPISYFTEYHRAKTTGEDISFGKVARDSVVNDILFRGAGKAFRYIQPQVSSKIGKVADGLYAKANMAKRLTSVHKRITYYDDMYVKRMAMSNPSNRSNVSGLANGPLNRFASSINAMSDTNNATRSQINRAYYHKNVTQVNSHFKDASLAPKILDAKGNYIGVSDLKSAMGTISKAMINSVKFGNVSIAKSMGLNHMMHDADSDIRYSQIKGKLILSQESIMKDAMDKSQEQRVAQTLAYHVGKSDVEEFIKTPFGSSMYQANRENKELMYGAIIIPENITATSSVRGLHYYDKSTRLTTQGGSKMMSTGLKEDAESWYIYDNNRAGSNLHHTYMGHVTGKYTKEDVGQTITNLLPRITGTQDTAMDELYNLNKSLGNEFVDVTIGGKRIITPILKMFHVEGRNAYRSAYASRAESIRNFSTTGKRSGPKIPFITPIMLVPDDPGVGSKLIDEIGDVRRYYSDRKISPSSRTEDLLAQVADHPMEAMRVKQQTTINARTGQVETSSYNTLNELNDTIANELYDNVLQSKSGWRKFSVNNNDNTVVNLYKNSVDNPQGFMDEFKDLSNDPVRYREIRDRFLVPIDPFNSKIDLDTNSKFAYAELLSPKGIMKNGDAQYFNIFDNTQPDKVHTVGELVMFTATSVVEPLARTLGVQTVPELGAGLFTFYEEIVNKSMWNIAGAYGAYTGVNALAENGAFDGTGLERGVLPFVGSVYNDIRMSTQFVNDISGVSSVARLMENAIPGLVDSPFGATMGTVLPIIGGIIAGANAVTPYGVAGGLGIGLIGSALLGGMGTGVYGNHDLTGSSSDLYGKFTGQDKIGVRKGRFWGPSSGSFWGDNIQYHRQYWSANNSDPRTSSDYYGSATQQITDNMGLTNPTARNYYTRPIVDFAGTTESFGLSNSIVSGSASTSSSNTSLNSIVGIDQNLTNDVVGGIHEEMYGMSEVYGMRGFLLKDAVIKNLRGDSIIDYQPQLQTADSIYSIDKMFWDSNYGGMMGNTEYIRRILPKYKQNINYVNPAPNLMPSWLPGSEYFINFKIGDPYSKIQEGQMRLPGLSYLKSNNVDLNNIPYDLDFMGFITNRETVERMLGMDNAISIENKTQRQMIKDNAVHNYKSGITGYQMYTRDNPVYYAGGNIIAQADLQVNSSAVKFEVVSNTTFKAVRNNRDTTYKRKADLLSTISQKPAIIIVINEDTKAQLTINGVPDQNLLIAEMTKLNKLKPEVYKKMREGGHASSNNLYSLADRYAILADVAPYASETRHYEKIMKDMARSGDLSDGDILKVSRAKRMKEAVINKSNFNRTGEQTLLSGILPDKALAPGNIDPLESYIGGISHGSRMKRWEEPLSYFRSDIATTLSGAANPIRRGINSSILYSVMYGGSVGLTAGLVTGGSAAIANAMGGININRGYMESREALLQESAYGFARNQASDAPYIGRNLYGQMMNGGNVNDLLNSIDTTDRSYIKAFANEQDPDRQKLIAQSIHPIYGSILDQKWGTNYADSTSYLNKATEYYNTLDDEDLNSSINIRDVTVKYLDKRGIDPRIVGRGFNQQRYDMYLSKGSNANSIELNFIQSIKSIHGVKNVKVIGNTADKVLEIIFVE